MSEHASVARWANLGPRIAHWILGLVFIGAGAVKIAHPLTFHALLLAYSIPAPERFFRSVALFLPWLEVVTGALLLANLWIETVLPVMAFLSLVFVGALSQAVIRGLDLSCGCFGGLGPAWIERPLAALGRAVVLLALSIWLLRLRKSANPEAAA